MVIDKIRMSKWILVGPAFGIILVTVALIVGYVVVPPIIVQRVTEVRKPNQFLVLKFSAFKMCQKG